MYKVLRVRDDTKCQKKEEDFPALRIALMHQYKELRNTFKMAKKDSLQQPVIALAT